MIERVRLKDKILAIIIRSSYSKEGIEFFTPEEFSQQLAYMKRSKNYVINPHIHNYTSRNVSLTQEVLFIKKGKVRVDFYDDDRTYLESRVLFSGDVILLANSGHGFIMLEESEIMEVKQGPYMKDKDKVKFKAVDSDHVIMKGKADE